MRLLGSILLIACLACASARISTDPIDWRSTDEQWSSHIVTIDPDGSERVTRVWLATVGDHGSVRTNDSRWWQNLQQDANCRIRRGGRDYPVHAEFVTEHAEKVRVDEAFEAKYGWQERLLFSREPGETHKHFATLHAGESS
jgi:hypothetical protein